MKKVAEKERSSEEISEQQIAELEQLKRDYVATFSSEAGKKVLKHLEGISYINKTTFAKDGQGLTLAFHEGMRFVIVHIKNMMVFDLKTLRQLAQKGE